MQNFANDPNASANSYEFQDPPFGFTNVISGAPQTHLAHYQHSNRSHSRVQRTFPPPPTTAANGFYQTPQRQLPYDAAAVDPIPPLVPNQDGLADDIQLNRSVQIPPQNGSHEAPESMLGYTEGLGNNRGNHLPHRQYVDNGYHDTRNNPRIQSPHQNSSHEAPESIFGYSERPRNNRGNHQPDHQTDGQYVGHGYHDTRNNPWIQIPPQNSSHEAPESVPGYSERPRNNRGNHQPHHQPHYQPHRQYVDHEHHVIQNNPRIQIPPQNSPHEAPESMLGYTERPDNNRGNHQSHHQPHRRYVDHGYHVTQNNPRIQIPRQNRSHEAPESILGYAERPDNNRGNHQPPRQYVDNGYHDTQNNPGIRIPQRAVGGGDILGWAEQLPARSNRSNHRY